MRMESKKGAHYFITLTGIVTVIFLLASLTDRELFRFHFNLFGFSLGLGVNAMELLIPLAAVVSVLGMYHALHTQMQIPRDQIIIHLFLPFTVTLTIGFTLRNMNNGLTGWGLLFVSSALHFLVLRFEYISCDPDSSYRPASIIVLDSLCYAVFLLFAIALRANVSRLIITLPAMFILCLGVSLKIYAFHIIGSSLPMLGCVTAFIICCADTGLHYWPVNIVSYGSLIFLWYYIITNLIIGADRDEPVMSIIRRILPAGIPVLLILVYSLIRL